MSSGSKIVYHYCPSEAFISILTNKTLRATNIKKSNDYSEITNGLVVFQRAVYMACTRFKKKHPWDFVFAEFYEGTDFRRLIENSIDNESLTYYAICFSEANDSLSQWRGYADNASGVAIGFDASLLHECMDHRNLKFMEIEYNAENVIEDLISYILKKLERTQAKRGDELKIADYENDISAVVSSFIYNAAFYKSKAFSEEQEWRLVFYPFGKIHNLLVRHRAKDISSNQLYYDRMSEYLGEETQYRYLIRKPLSFGLRRNNIFSYFDFDFSSIAFKFIKEIILGPKNSMDDLDLRLFLINSGYDVTKIEIRHSNATYQ